MIYLLVGIAFPALFIAFMYAWKLLVILLKKFSAPAIVCQVVLVLGGVASLAGAFWCCREIWRRRPR